MKKHRFPINEMIKEYVEHIYNISGKEIEWNIGRDIWVEFDVSVIVSNVRIKEED